MEILRKIIATIQIVLLGAVLIVSVALALPLFYALSYCAGTNKPADDYGKLSAKHIIKKMESIAEQNSEASHAKQER